MWFGTRDGLNRYDGYQFKVYKKDSNPESIVSNDVRILYFDTLKNELWIGTNSGLSKYNSETDNFYNYIPSSSDPTSISNRVIRQIFRDSKGKLWVGTSDGLNLLNEDNHTFRNTDLNFPDNNESHDIKAIMEDSEGTLWFGTTGGLYYMESETNGKFIFNRADGSANWKLSDTHIKSIIEDKKGNFWLGTLEGGINYLDRKNESVTVYRNEKDNPYSLSHNNIRSMVIDENNDLWVGTFDGLNLFRKKTEDFLRFTKKEVGDSGLSDKSIRCVYIDRRGGLWLGTYYGGVNHLDEKYNRFTNYRHGPVGNVLSGNIVSSFMEDENENLWIGTEGDGLNFYNTKLNKFTSYKRQSGTANSLSGNNVKQLLLDDNQLWIGTFQEGLNVLNLKTKIFNHYKNDPRNPHSLSSNNVYGLLKENGLLYICTFGGGLNVLNLTTKQFQRYYSSEEPGSLSSDLNRVIIKSSDGQLWIGGEQGLNKVSRDKDGYPEKFTAYLDDYKIYSLQEDLNKHIWVGTFANGLFRFNPKDGSTVHFTTKDGLPGNTVFGILIVDSTEIWISTNNGLSKLNPQQNSFTNYNYSNGLDNSEYNFNAYYKTKSGDLLFGGVNGFTQFNPRSIQPNQFIPPVVFTELRKNNTVINVSDESGLLNKSINDTEEVTFNYNEANFTLGIAALDYFSPETNHYAFMLEGIDRDWNYSTGKTEPTYTIQKEGEYSFRMKGGNSDGIWNPEERKLKIVVLPPPWRTWWAYLIYFFLFATMIYGLIRFIRLRHRLQLEQIEKQKQEELHEIKLRFFTNITHEFRTPLTLILGPLNDLMNSRSENNIDHRQLSLIQRNAQRLLNLVNQVLTFRKLATDHEPLKIMHGNIVEFLHEIFLLFSESAIKRDMSYHFISKTSEIQAWYDADKMEKVFFNLLSNAFKFTPDGGEITLAISQDKETIKIEVSDSGVGIEKDYHDQIFKRFYEKSEPKTSTIKGTGIGLAISKQMVELHKGRISVITTTDTKEDRGATFLVELLKGKEHFDLLKVECLETSRESIQTYEPIIVEKSESKTHLIPIELDKKTDTKKLLIVEDNPEVRNYIKEIFINEYKIVEAKNGRDGLDTARSALPDLVISDVMMPVMDGIDFCNQLKTDIEISHIPLILLTARTASLFKIEGLKTGADDYITKPFNPEELRLRVRNILQARQEVRNKFARVLNFDPKEIKITSSDEAFLENALKIVEKHMGDYEFNVNTFAHKLTVSRPLLFKKLKALTGQTPNTFIKTIRLKRAAQLIQSEKLNISEISHRVGFKDPKYFRKCFKEQFSVTPSNYILEL